MEAIELTKGLFSLDAYEDSVFEGYTQGTHWNGFECPFFTFESAQRIVEMMSVDQMTLYDAVNDEFIFAQDEEEDAERFGAIFVEGLGKLYPVGTYGWTWSKKESLD